MTQITRTEGLVGNTAIKAPCRLATTASLGASISGLAIVDGVQTVSGDRILRKNESDGTLNGIWVADTGTWERSEDLDGSYDASCGTLVVINEGATNTSTCWMISTADPITIGTTSIVFIPGLFSSLGSTSFLQAGTGAVTRSMQEKERDILSVFDYMSDAQKADVKAGTAAVDVTSAIQAAHDAAVSLGFLSVIFPGGTYKVVSSINWSPYIMAKSLGQVIFKTAIAAGNFIHVSTQYGEHAAPYSLKHSKSIVFIGQFYLENTNGANAAVAFYVGDVPASSAYYAHMTSFWGIEIWGFATDITYGTNAFDIEWQSCFFLGTLTTSINIPAAAANSGENMKFINCMFGGGVGASNAGSVLNPNNINGWDIQFIGCTFAYRSKITEAVAATLTTLNFFGCHYEWDGANTLFNHTGGIVNNYGPFFYSISAVKANPFIAAIGAATVHNVIGAQYIMPTGAAVTALYNVSNTSGKLSVDYAPAVLGGTLPTNQETHAVGSYVGYNGIHYEANEFTATLTGCTSTPTYPAYYSRIGTTVTINLTGTMTGTSNAITKTLTGMPSNLFPTRQKRGICNVSDNGGANTIATFTIGTNGVITLYAGPGFTNWTAAGTATIYDFTFTYTTD